MIQNDFYRDEQGNEHRWVGFPAELVSAIDNVTQVFGKNRKMDCFDIQIGTIVTDIYGKNPKDNLISLSFVYKRSGIRQISGVTSTTNVRKFCGISHTYILDNNLKVIRDYGQK